MSYLKFWNKELGILVNFGLPRIETERVLFSEKELIVSEDYDEIMSFIKSRSKHKFEIVRTIILDLFEMYGLGYHFNIYKKLFQAELNHHNIPFLPNISIPIIYEQKVIRNYELNHPIVCETILCGITAGQDNLTPHICRMKNYLKKTSLPVGILINFGKKKLEIIGVNNKFYKGKIST